MPCLTGPRGPAQISQTRTVAIPIHDLGIPLRRRCSRCVGSGSEHQRSEPDDHPRSGSLRTYRLAASAASDAQPSALFAD